VHKEPLAQQDLFEAYDIFGTKLSCAAVAEALNRVLGNSHCCFSVKCSGQTTDTEIGPGVTIDPAFR